MMSSFFAPMLLNNRSLAPKIFCLRSPSKKFPEQGLQTHSMMLSYPFHLIYSYLISLIYKYKYVLEILMAVSLILLSNR